MTEFEARRALLSDPRRVSPALQAALEHDPRLAALREDLLRADLEIQRCATEPVVPEGLAERLVLQARYRERSRWRLALVASVALIGIALAVSMVSRGPTDQQAMIDHVAAGIDELRDDAGVDATVLQTSVRALGVDVRTAGFRVRHLANCIVAGREGRHFTLDTPWGVVSVVVLPNATRTGPQHIEQDGFQGRFVRRGDAAIGVFADARISPAALDGLLQRVLA